MRKRLINKLLISYLTFQKQALLITSRSRRGAGREADPNSEGLRPKNGIKTFRIEGQNQALLITSRSRRGAGREVDPRPKGLRPKNGIKTFRIGLKDNLLNWQIS
jgi:hypothetical protein